jgi:hypothetical protein
MKLPKKKLPVGNMGALDRKALSLRTSQLILYSKIITVLTPVQKIDFLCWHNVKFFELIDVKPRPRDHKE